MQLKEITTLQAEEYPNQMQWSKQANFLAIALADGKAKVWHSTQNRWYSLTADTLACMKVAFDDSAQILATAGQDGVLKLWKTTTWELINQIKIGNFWINDLAWAPQTNYLAIIAGKKVEIRNEKTEIIYQQSFEYTPNNLQWLNEHTLIIAKYGGLTSINLSQLDAIQEYVFPTALTCLACSPNQSYIAGGTQDNSVHFWKLPYVPETDLAMSGYPHKVKSLSWHKDSTHLATHSQNKVVLWAVAQKGGPAGSKPIILHDHAGKVNKVVFAAQSNLLWSGDSLGMICLFDHTKSNKAILKDFFGSSIIEIAWANDDKFIAFATENGQIGIYEH